MHRPQRVATRSSNFVDATSVDPLSPQTTFGIRMDGVMRGGPSKHAGKHPSSCQGLQGVALIFGSPIITTDLQPTDPPPFTQRQCPEATIHPPCPAVSPQPPESQTDRQKEKKQAHDLLEPPSHVTCPPPHQPRMHGMAWHGMATACLPTLDLTLLTGFTPTPKQAPKTPPSPSTCKHSN